MAPSAQAILVLLSWCEENNIRIDPRIRVQYDHSSGIGVYSGDLPIPPYTSLVHIHRESVLSARTCSLSNNIPPNLYGPEAQLALTLALYGELIQGTSSRWYGYLQSLPKEIVDLPIFWKMTSTGLPDDGLEGLRWLKGTEFERLLRQQGGNTLETITEYYLTVAEPLLNQRFGLENGEIGLHGFYHAYSLVSSRAFLVDAFHGLAMVPIADAFNHIQENHVHLQTEFGVCPSCGSLHQCPHDEDDVDITGGSISSFQPRVLKAAAHLYGKNDPDMYYEMVSNAPVPPNTEVYNTYGEFLTNSQLISQYGFILDVNENDSLSWTHEEAYSCISEAMPSQDIDMSKLLTIWSSIVQSAIQYHILEGISDSQLIFLHPERSSENLCLNGDGKISYPLWVFLALPLIAQKDSSYGDIEGALRVLLDSQLRQEAMIESMGDNRNAFSLDGDSSVRALARSVINLCRSRKKQLGKRGADSLDLGDILDTLPVHAVRTKKAISIVMSESSILNCCELSWVDILTFLSE